MRHFAPLLLLGAILLTACNPKQEPTQKGLDPSARLYINVRNNTMKVTNSTDTTTTDDPVPTPREVVERAGCFMFTEPRQGLTDRPLGIDDVQKDYEHERIMMWGGMIMNDFDNKEGRLELNDYFLKVRDLRILAPMREGETENPIIAYIPNKRMEDAEAAITKAYNEGNYNEVYRLFQELYTAIPTTTARWKALKEKGLQ
ncbi:hypothetical protein PORUE0001_0064 [Porphyromonas uenonis 60-3]|uniref:Uncharacterized protein n=1 Tax=Porphyromonas uenonis 60-3 TaxID=596327 RepID=C2MB87_9PORP|nr:hypothetical protein [Porphyromonas uenonis]EEK17002.1 hypothetical protein PORUE0001_0064 [Porphyromonas uenonis 60-3]